MKVSPTLFVGGMALLVACNRTDEFRAQAHAGRPIVRAIEEYRKQTGTYPVSLADLSPMYLSAIPDLPDESKHKFTGWDYRVVTNGSVASFSLRNYMGKGGVEYEPPRWIGVDEGRRTVIAQQ